ncbi:adenylyl-sulfate kinase [Candidatus Kaiserbacteria bacterium]|nr:adenylyl-sulfate kinase [Candidatus Kaiserbacteria bacterium]
MRDVPFNIRSDVVPNGQAGTVVFFTGLSGAGKSTLSTLLAKRLEREYARQVTLLDGDVIRTHLTLGLGFSKEDRDMNVMRAGFVAAEVAKHGGIALCALIAPYHAARRWVRDRVVAQQSAFIEVYVATSLAECERRDTKGLYARARQGETTGLTGVDDPYEVPENPEIVLQTEGTTPEILVEEILTYLRRRGLSIDRTQGGSR